MCLDNHQLHGKHGHEQEAQSITIRGGEVGGEKGVRRHLEGGREDGRGDIKQDNVVFPLYS